MSRKDNGSISDSSLAMPRALVDDAAAINPPGMTLSEVMYVTEGRSLKALALLSLGLTNDDGSPTFNPLVLPWSAAAPPSSLKFAAKELTHQIKYFQQRNALPPRPYSNTSE